MSEIVWLRRGLFLVTIVALAVSALMGMDFVRADLPKVEIPKIDVKIPEQAKTTSKHDENWYAPIWVKHIRPKDEILPKPPKKEVEKKEPERKQEPTKPLGTQTTVSVPLDIKVRGVICGSDGEGVVFLESKSGEQEWFRSGEFLCGERIQYPDVQVLEVHKNYVLFKNGSKVERKDIEQEGGGSTSSSGRTESLTRPKPAMPSFAPTTSRAGFQPLIRRPSAGTPVQSATALMKLTRKIMLGTPPPMPGGVKRPGILVRYVNPNEMFGRGKTKETRLFPGDLILSVNGEGMPGQPLDAYNVLQEKIKEGGTLSMEIERKKQRFSVSIEVPPENG